MNRQLVNACCQEEPGGNLSAQGMCFLQQQVLLSALILRGGVCQPGGCSHCAHWCRPGSLFPGGRPEQQSSFASHVCTRLFFRSFQIADLRDGK